MTTFLLDAGHGKDTKGKRSPEIPPGIYEWEFNMKVVALIEQLCAEQNIPTHIIKPEEETITLKERITRANKFWEKDKNCIFVSVHANAIGYGKWNDASGVTVFCNNNPSEISKNFAISLTNKISYFGEFRNRGVKEKGFYVLKRTNMPAILTENGFMTNKTDATKLASDFWRYVIAASHVEAIREFNR